MTQAAGLGKITVFSALGQPLRAEAEIFASREELAGMKAQLASQDAHKQAGVDYSGTLGGISFSIAKRANGQPIIRMSSDRPINDPFVDLLLELNWPAGRLVREYTFLLDPPEYAAKHTPAPAISKPGVSASQPLAEGRPARTEAPRSRPARPAPRQPVEGSAYEVRPGETLGKIANDTRPEGVSLDQMLVAIFRANPDAFERGNMNRLKAGKVLTIPDRSAIDAVPRDDARRAVTAQSADWGGYRRKLARQAAAAPVTEAAPKQQSAGKISAKVEDKSSPAVEPKDQLKVSKTELPGAKPATPGKRSDEDLIAKEKALRDANERLATLEKNVAELQKLVELKTRTLAELEKQSAGKPAPSVPAGKPEEARPPTTPSPSAPLSSTPPSTTPVPATPAAKPPVAPQAKPVETLPATAPVPAKPAEPTTESKPDDKLTAAKTDEAKPTEPIKPVAPPAAEVAKPVEKPKPKVITLPPEEPGVFDDLLTGAPLIAGGGLIAALAGAYWLAKRRRMNRNDSLLDLNSTLSPTSSDSLAANSAARSSGGQSVDTSHSMMSQADFSQAGPGSIDTDEVDPVAEADVYMAYGRDAQAEEILLEAKQKTPSRYAIHLKLLEIYLARKQDKTFNATITELFNATGGSGPDWEKAAGFGRQMEPNNPLYAVTTAPEPEKAPVEEVTASTSASVAKAPLPPGRMGDMITRPGELSRMAEAATAAAAMSSFAAAATEVNTHLQPKASPVDETDDSTFDLGEATVAVTNVQNLHSPQSTTVFAQSATVGPIDFDLATSISSAQRVPNIEFNEPPLLVEDHEVPEMTTMLVAPGTDPDAPATGDDLDFEFDLTTEFADHRVAAEPTQIESPPSSNEVLDIGTPEKPDLEFDVKLTESTVLGQTLQQSPFDMSSISLDLDEMDTQSPNSATEFATDTELQSSFETEQEDTLLNPAAGMIHAESPADPYFDGNAPGDTEITASEEVATKLDLAKAYHEMGDHEGARELLLEVLKDGDSEQRDAASVLLASLRE